MMHVDNATVTPIKPTARSRVSNGTCLIPGVDGRSTWVRRARDVIHAHISDLGGLDLCSEAERSIVRRSAVLTVELELLEKRFALNGQATESELDLYQRTANSLRRLLESVGIQRRPKAIQGLEMLLEADYEA